MRFIFLLSFVMTSSLAQEKSLAIEMSDFQSLYAKTIYFENINIDSAMFYGNLALKAAYRDQSPSDQFKVIVSLIVAEILSTHYNEALQNCKSLDSIAIITNNIEKHADALMYTGVVYQNMGLTRKGLEYVLQAKRIAEENNFIKSIGEINYYLSYIYKDLGETEKSIRLAKMSISALESIHDHKSIFKAYILLSNSYHSRVQKNRSCR